MDVQGAEHMVFEGATEILNKIKYIYTEIGHHELYKGQVNFDSLLEYLPGFKIVELFEGDVLLINESFSLN
jgi:hypothetical protein